MVTNTTLETINYIKDVEIEYNIKIIIMCLAFIYALTLIWFSNKWKMDELWTQIIKWFLMRIPSFVILVFMPLFTIYLWRTASWELVYGLMIAYYSYAFVVILIAGKLGMFTFMMKMLGMNTKPMKMETKRFTK